MSRVGVRHVFYVYVYRDPETGDPVYVGKGYRDRAWSHLNSRNSSAIDWFIARCQERGLDVQPEIVFQTDVEKEALNEEVRLIALYGRRDHNSGTLFNRTNGGAGCHGIRIRRDGWVRSERLLAALTEFDRAVPGWWARPLKQRPELVLVPAKRKIRNRRINRATLNK